jgi:AcrR family transcriptional regulator
MNLNSPVRRAPRRLRDRFKDATRVAILEAAEQAFATDGVLTARMETIASKAGVAVGTLYNHFADRHAVVDALMRLRQKELLTRLDDTIATHEGQPFATQLDAFVASLQAHFTEHEGFVRVLMEGENQNFGKKVLQPTEMMSQLRERLDVLLARGAKAKAVRTDDLELTTWFFLGAMRAMLVRRMKGFAHEPLETQRAALLRFLLRGAEARAVPDAPRARR